MIKEEVELVRLEADAKVHKISMMLYAKINT